MRAIQLVAEQCARGLDALFLVIGADTYLDSDTFIWLEQARRFAQPTIRSGFIPGEGVGCVALATEAVRSALDLPPLAYITGIGTAQEALLRDSETGTFGEGMSRAVLDAAAGLLCQATPSTGCTATSTASDIAARSGASLR